MRCRRAAIGTGLLSTQIIRVLTACIVRTLGARGPWADVDEVDVHVAAARPAQGGCLLPLRATMLLCRRATVGSAVDPGSRIATRAVTRIDVRCLLARPCRTGISRCRLTIANVALAHGKATRTAAMLLTDRSAVLWARAITRVAASALGAQPAATNGTIAARCGALLTRIALMLGICTLT